MRDLRRLHFSTAEIICAEVSQFLRCHDFHATCLPSVSLIFEMLWNIELFSGMYRLGMVYKLMWKCSFGQSIDRYRRSVDRLGIGYPYAVRSFVVSTETGGDIW